MYRTKHELYIADSQDMSSVRSNSVDLVITSPPYPGIKMWDELFCELDPWIADFLENNDYKHAFHAMHAILNKTWAECVRVLKPGGIMCLNIGDATRKMGKDFRLWTNRARIQDYVTTELGLTALPGIIWRKMSNKPNKFMGSGMLPPNGYVTLEHEYILILRKGSIRQIPDRSKRDPSGYFFEERNQMFTDLWDIPGAKQNGEAVFPRAIPMRLIHMFSLYGDTVLDPFLGTGTTMLSGILLSRNSIGYEINPEFVSGILDKALSSREMSEEYNTKRLRDHVDYVNNRKKNCKYLNTVYGTPVVTKQETELSVRTVTDVSTQKLDLGFVIHADYADFKPAL